MVSDIGQRIKEARKRKKLKQSDLARCLGVTTVTISNYETGTAVPTLKRIQEIAYILESSPGYLLGTQEHILDESAARALERMYGVAGGTLQEYTKDYTATEAAEIKLRQLIMEKYENQFRGLMSQLNDAGKEEALRRLREMTFVPEFQKKGD